LAGIAAQRTMVALDGPSGPVVRWSTSGVEVDGMYTGDEQQLTLTVEGAADEVHWVVDGEEVAVHSVEAATLLVRPGDAPVRVRAEVWRDGRPTVLTSHRWLVAGDPGAPVADSEPRHACSDDCDGTPCGCGVAGPQGAVGGLFLALSVGGVRRRSARASRMVANGRAGTR